MVSGGTVFIVDSDAETRKRTSGVVRSMKLRYESYALAQDFLDKYDPQRSGCAIFEVRLPDISGLQLQEQLAQQTPAVLVIFLASHASVPVVVRAIQQGAVNFLQKPADEQELWDTIQRALQIDRERRAAVAEIENLRGQLALLTEKELDVLMLMAREKGTRSIARELDVSVRTVEFRRCRMLQKLQLTTPVQLLHFAIRATQQYQPDSDAQGNGQGSGKSLLSRNLRRAMASS